MRNILEIVRDRHSSRAPFDPQRCVSEHDLLQILEAARWAPTAHNMQNFEIILIDDKATLAAIAGIRVAPSETFIRENYAQLSFSEAELLQRKTGLLASMFPASWRTPGVNPKDMTGPEHSFLGSSLQNCWALLVVIYDMRKRAPASEGDTLGIMSLGCVMQNIWLAAEALGIGMQILSVFSSEDVEDQVHRILAMPDHMRIAFACRLGYPQAVGKYLRVRRDLHEFTHHNRYGNYGISPNSPEKPPMANQMTDVVSELRPGGRNTQHILEQEAYRRIVAGDIPETLSAFAAQLSAWFRDSYPSAPAVPARFIEDAIRDTWHRRHEVIGSEL